MEEVYVGIDVSKGHLDVAMRGSAQAMPAERYTNDEPGIRQLATKLIEVAPDGVVLEATGGYERAAVRCLMEVGVPVSVVNPRFVRDFARSTGKLAKTDTLDASILARFAEVHRPQPEQPIDATSQCLKSLLARRLQLVKMSNAELLRLDTADAHVRASIQSSIQRLQADRIDLERRIAAVVRDDADLSRRVDLLCSIKGIGQTTAILLVTNLPELGTLSNKQIAALVGLAPMANDSGKRHGARRIAAGRSQVRHALYMPALSAKERNPQLACFYRRLHGRGKPPMVALIAVMRKLLVVCNAVLRDEVPWSPHHTQIESTRSSGVDLWAGAPTPHALDMTTPVHISTPSGPTRLLKLDT